ncbi:Nuclear transcription factor Y subunit B-3 [Apostasia shenzhenica]|uniref:Nuclear transcription factor Y subunit B-3 n=1 Tax=Apostasia shenzhenica TaxID=1088818 RepID=A0A2I0BFM6_9ASPA|nr:Nuclear transcription factor Y subunit B-3 [Apostasia shenzhenica]
MEGRRKGTPPDNETGSPAAKDPDRFLPIANVSRIMKRSLPSNAKVSKEAKETVQECVSEFISFITGEASDKCRREKRKTINGDDLLWAMETLGFDSYVVPLKSYLNRCRASEGERNFAARQQLHDGSEDCDDDQTSPSEEGDAADGQDGGFFPAAAARGFSGRMGGGVHENSVHGRGSAPFSSHRPTNFNSCLI